MSWRPAKKGEKASKNILFDCVSFCSMMFCILLSFILTSVADPGSSVFLPRDLWSGHGKKSRSGTSRIIFLRAKLTFFGFKILCCGSGIQDPVNLLPWIRDFGSGMVKFGAGVRDKH
jgi:hypothetical protein